VRILGEMASKRVDPVNHVGDIAPHVDTPPPGSNAIMSYLSWLSSPQDYMPHGMCFLWQPELIMLHVASDAAIAASYYSIPFALIYFVSKRTDLAFPGVFLLTGAFILACGTTHIMSIWTLWQPDYRFDGFVKLITALVSVTTAFAMWRTMPSALALPSTAQLERANRSLAREIVERQRAQAALGDMNAELERRVALRTAELEEEVAHRKRSEQALRDSAAQLRTLIETAVDGVVLIDARGAVLIFNPACEKLFGYSVAEVIGENVKMLMPEPYWHEHDRYIANYRDTRKPKIIGIGRDVVARRKNGSTFPIRLSVGEAKEQGESIFVGIIHDLTSRKRSEAELEQARTELARVARVTTLGELTAAIAHEVNQPLTGLVNGGNACLQWLAREPPNLEAARQSVKRMMKAGNLAGEVISRIRSLVAKSPPQRDRLNINDTITEVIALIGGEVRRNRISLQTKLSNDVPLILGDRIQLQQVILNLILNAMEAMSGICGALKVLSISSVKDGSNGVLVAVRDSGVGLDRTALDRLFEAFYTTKTQGMGMGLAVSRTIIEAHGGRLWAMPNMPQGAIFQFRLPMHGEEVS
jgi:PAS domain S-box-containing protein